METYPCCPTVRGLGLFWRLVGMLANAAPQFFARCQGAGCAAWAWVRDVKWMPPETLFHCRRTRPLGRECVSGWSFLLACSLEQGWGRIFLKDK